jgi:hypothetical protein
VHLFTLTDVAGTGIELDVLYNAADNDDVLDWKAIVPLVHGQGPLLVLARTDKGYVSGGGGGGGVFMLFSYSCTQQCVWRVPHGSL